MQLLRRVSLTLIPIISFLVIALSLAIWKYIFDQTRSYEIESARLSVEIALVDTHQRAMELISGLDGSTEYQSAIAGSLSENNEHALDLTQDFSDLDHLLNQQKPWIEEVILLNQELEVLAISSNGNEQNGGSVQIAAAPETLNAINELRTYLQTRLLTKGVITFQAGETNRLVAAQFFSFDELNGFAQEWSENLYILAMTADALALETTNRLQEFNIQPNGAASPEELTTTPIQISETRSEQGTLLFTNSSLFHISSAIDNSEVIQHIAGFTFILVAISLAVIFSLVVAVLGLVNRQILLPINRLEQRVRQSMRTGRIELQPGNESSEVESLGNRYLELMTQISRLANMDTLTQLPNRDQFLLSVATIIKHHPDDEYVMFYLDLDRFKQVNDFYGYDEGNRLLKTFAKEFQQVIEENLQSPSERTALISRLSGDEFAVFVNTSLLSSTIKETAENIVQRLAKEFKTKEGALHLEASMGIACYPVHALEAEALLARADEAMFEAKSRGKNRWQILNPKIVEQNDFKKAAQEAIEDAIAKNQFHLVFQPIFETQSLKPVAAEVLLRSTQPTLAKVSTQTFINIAEESGAIRRIDDISTRLAIEKLVEVQKILPDFSFSINYSASGLVAQNFAEGIAQIVEQAHLSPDAVEIEITETQLTEFGIQALENLEKLHECGFRVALDDFGAGYNSFAQLNSGFVSRLKIDKQFIAAINKDSRDANMASIILGTAKLYGFETVAEGIETKEQQEYVSAKGCEFIQGYLLAKPMEWDDFRKFLDDQT